MLTNIIVGIIIGVSVIWGVLRLIDYFNRAYERALTQLQANPRDEATIRRVIQCGRDYYFEHDTYQRLPPTTLLQNISILNELRQRNPYLHDDKIKKDMRTATRINYENFFPKRPQPDADPSRKP